MAQFGPHRWNAGEYTQQHTDEFTGATFEVRDLTNTRFVDCDLSGARVIDAALVDVDLSGWVERLVVNGIDVTDYVAAELDRRHPERVQLREMRGADDFRALWSRLQQLWDELGGRGAQHPDEQVDGEWSYSQTLRHLVWITDSWASRTVLDEPMPYHRLGLPQTAYPVDAARELGIDPDATPTFEEVLAARRDRQDVVSGILATLQDSDLGRPCDRTPAPGYPEGGRPVWECLAVVLDEECDHYRYALRDLDKLHGDRSE